MKVSRRRFVSSSAGAMVAAGLGAEARAMLLDEVPVSPNFSPLPLKGNSTWEKLAESNVSDLIKAAARTVRCSSLPLTASPPGAAFP